MSTTSILNAFLSKLNTFGVLPIAWPGIPMTPPSTGMWLEARFFPNEPQDLVWDNDSQLEIMGFFQVAVYWRPNENSLIAASAVADVVITLFYKGLPVDATMVVKTPWQSPAIDLVGKSFIPVTVPYQSIVSIAGYAGELTGGDGETTDILISLLERVGTLSLSPVLPVAWPGIQTTPPTTGMWLEVRFLPKESQDLVWDVDTQKDTTGALLIRVYYRPGIDIGQHSQVAASTVADSIIDHFPKGLGIDAVRISKAPYQGPAVDLEGKSYIPIIIPYRGIVQVLSITIPNNAIVDDQGRYVLDDQGRYVTL